MTASASVESQKRKKKGTTSSVGIRHLQEVRNAGKKDHLLSSNTTRKYDSTIVRCRAWLKVLVEGGKESLSDDLDAQPDIDKAEFAKAFDDIPNQYSSEGLGLYIVAKCLTDDNKESTATGAHAAFAKLWDQV